MCFDAYVHSKPCDIYAHCFQKFLEKKLLRVFLVFPMQIVFTSQPQNLIIMASPLSMTSKI